MTSNSEISLKINLNDYPMLKSFKKKDQDKTIIEFNDYQPKEQDMRLSITDMESVKQQINESIISI
jgi:hypothetical protein